MKVLHVACVLIAIQIVNSKDMQNVISNDERTSVAGIKHTRPRKGDLAGSPTHRRIFITSGTGHSQYFPDGDGAGSYGWPASDYNRYGDLSKGGNSGHLSGYGTEYDSPKPEYLPPQPEYIHPSGPNDYGHSDHGISTHHSHSSHSAQAIKAGLLIPLAGLVLLGAATALSTNPILLQLGVVKGRRKRSSTHDFVGRIRKQS